jgi:O-antigen biosynthesis protein
MGIDLETFGSGERLVPWHPARMIREHEVRYRLAEKILAPGGAVLECACGSGYGLRYLSRRAKSVLAMDISEESIEFARANFGAPNVEFKVGSAEDLGLPSEAFDAYVSFETIEHVDHPEKLLDEALRVLRPGGVFLVSTPNRIWSRLGPGEKPTNPWHKIEWSLAEFDALLRGRFESIDHYGQRVRSGNKFQPQYVLSKVKRGLGLVDVVRIPDRTVKAGLETDSSWQPENFVAVCRKRA